MPRDRYPYRELVQRLFDLMLFFVAVAALCIAAVMGLAVENPTARIILSCGMAATAAAAIVDYRQKSRYDHNHIEASLLSNELQAKYLNTIAKLRHKLASYTILLVVFGIWVSGYGAVW
jgi:hypothetical protein